MADFSDLMTATRSIVDPTTSGADLAQIAQAQPGLWPQIAAHPNAYPDLLTWLEANGGATTKQAVAARNAAPSPAVPSPPPPQAPVATVVAPITPVSTPGPSLDNGSPGWAILGFFIPVVGLILWIVWHATRPRDSKMARNGFIASMALIILATAGTLVWLFAAVRASTDGTGQNEPSIPPGFETLTTYHQCVLQDVTFLEDQAASKGMFQASLDCSEGQVSAVLPSCAQGEGTLNFGAHGGGHASGVTVFLTMGLVDDSPQVWVGGPPADYSIYGNSSVGFVVLNDGTQITYSIGTKGVFPAGYTVTKPDGTTYSRP